VPEGQDQYEILRNFRSEPYREDIRYASVPFVYSGGKSRSPALAPLVKEPAAAVGIKVPPPAILPAAQPVKQDAPVIKSPVKPTQSPSGFVPLKPVSPPAKADDGFKPMPNAPKGFIPVKKKD